MSKHQLNLYSARALPVLQNRLYQTEDEARHCGVGDVDLVEDLVTGLVYNASFRPELVCYDEHYDNEQAASSVFREHLAHVCSTLERTMGQGRLVEIGCGKGRFLELLLSRGFDVIGFDPTYTGTNPRVSKRFFEEGVGIQADGIVLRHVLEHIQNPVDFLFQLQAANGGRGRIYIEVPCLDWIIANRTWFDIFYEHVNYFRLSDFERMFGVLYEARHSFGGQYLSIVAELGSLRSPRRDPARGINFPKDFSRTVAPSRGKQSVVWGAGSKGIIFSIAMERADAAPDFVVDINSAKQAKHLPITGLKVLSPDEVMDQLEPDATVYVMNSMYMPEIRELSSNRFRYVAPAG